MITATIDLNADLGEGGLFDIQLLDLVSSCNIACGGHAGDAASMHVIVTNAIQRNVAIGAHPSYPDTAGFGRRSRFSSGLALQNSLTAQILELARIVESYGRALAHVKPHGALYNDAAGDRSVAACVIAAMSDAVPEAALVGLPESELQRAAADASIRFVGEGFVDRAYKEDGRLLPRSEHGALLSNIDKIVTQAVSLAASTDTLCIHGDAPNAAEAARAVRNALEQAGLNICAPGR